jgi:tetratricopeptide (TPR) repeat protein
MRTARLGAHGIGANGRWAAGSELALTEDPDNAETIAWVGRMIAWADRDFGRAKEMADKAVAIDQNSALAWAQRGWVYHYSGEPDEAILSFQRAIRLSPRDRMLWSTFVGKALAEARSGRYGDAVGTADRARIQNPAFSTTFRCLASCFANLGRMDEARLASRRRTYARRAADHSTGKSAICRFAQVLPDSSRNMPCHSHSGLHDVRPGKTRRG